MDRGERPSGLFEVLSNPNGLDETSFHVKDARAGQEFAAILSSTRGFVPFLEGSLWPDGVVVAYEKDGLLRGSVKAKVQAIAILAAIETFLEVGCAYTFGNG